VARKFLTAVDLAKNELQNAAVQNLGSAPGSPVKGQLYFDTGGNILYWYNGSGWVAAQGGAGAVPATTVTTQAIGDTPIVGVATTYAREDHKHGEPGFGVITSQTTFGGASTNGVSANIARSDHTHGTPAHDAAAHSAISLSALAVPTADTAWGGFKVTNLGAPATGSDAANKTYVDNAIAGLSWKEAVRLASTANRALTGLTAVDSVTPSANDRVLLKDQSTAAENGIWLAQSGAWTRATDADALGELEGAAVWVIEGTTNGDKSWTCTTDGAITPGTTPTAWAQFGGGSAIIGGTGLTVTGSTVNLTAANGSLNVGADDVQVAYAGTGTTFGSAVTAARSDHNHDGTYTKKFAQDCAASTSTTVTHNLNTQDVTVSVYLKSGTFEEVDVDIEHTSVNVVTVRFAVAPTAGAYRIVVTG
jgi:hypothetical protein